MGSSRSRPLETYEISMIVPVPEAKSVSVVSFTLTLSPTLKGGIMIRILFLRDHLRRIATDPGGLISQVKELPGRHRNSESGGLSVGRIVIPNNSQHEAQIIRRTK